MKLLAFIMTLVYVIGVSSAVQREKSAQRKFKRQSYGSQLPATPTATQYGGGYSAPATGGAPIGGGGAYRSPAPAYGGSQPTSGGYQQPQRVTSVGSSAPGGGYARPSSGAPSGANYGGGQAGGQYGGGQQQGGGGHGGQGQDYDDGANPLPGVAGQDYPTYGPHPPQTNFNCLNVQHVPGYYANPDYQCQVFHICEPGGKVNTFLCPNGTIFNQKYFVCDWWYNVNCGEATSYYGVNGNLFQVPEGGYGGRVQPGGGQQPASQAVYSTGPSQVPSGVPQTSYGTTGPVRQQPNQQFNSYAPSQGTVGY